MKTIAFTLHGALLAAVDKHPQKPALICAKEKVSYQQLASEAARISGYLQAAGLPPGGRVAIYMDNTPTCAAAIYGALMAGGAFMVINPQTKREKLDFILRDAAAHTLITDAHLENQYAEIITAQSSLTSCVYSGPESALSNTAIPYLNLSTIAETDLGEAIKANQTGADLAALIYTSGSTGNPKGVMMTHQSMVFTSASLNEYLRQDSEDIILNVLPMAFDYGLYQLLMTIALGATLALERSFTFPGQIYKFIEATQATSFPGVPTIFATMVNHHQKKPLRFESIRRITNTAAALPEEHMSYLKEIFPNALIFKMYGLTECKRVCYLEPELIESKPFSVGKAMPGTEVQVLDHEGNPSKPNENGILHVRGPHVMQGYWNQPELTQQMIKPGRYPGDQMLCTHDWFKMDEEGFLYFQGRTDDIIKTRGEKVSPIEIENALYGIKGIKEAAVIGVPDQVLGASVIAFLSKEPGAEIGEREVKKICMSKLENFMVPSRIVFLEKLPQTATGKISKKDLKLPD